MLVSSPRTWGCFRCPDNAADQQAVFPTHVGVFLFRKTRVMLPVCLPHARGGVSLIGRLDRVPDLSSPRTWGCFYPPLPVSGIIRVFPTHVGVFPSRFHARSACPRLPHARGGVSSYSQLASAARGSSPRTWGCFLTQIRPFMGEIVFPTHVGVFLRYSSCFFGSACLPHARGGVSNAAFVSGCW